MKHSPLVVLLTALCAATARAQGTADAANDGRWHWDLSVPLWAAGLDGTTSFRGLPPQEVKASFSDIIENFDFGFAGHVEARKNRVGVATDVLFINLGADLPTSGPLAGVTDPQADVRQIDVEGFVFYRLVTRGSAPENQSTADVFVGARYAALRTQIRGDRVSGTRRTFDWVEGLLGMRGYAGLGRKWGLRGRIDAATFGSDLTWNLEGSLAWRLSRRWTIDAGYRYLDVDYDNGEGTERVIYKMKTYGPVITVRFIS